MPLPTQPCVTAIRQAGASEAMAGTAAPEQLKGGTDGMPLYMPLEDISFGPDSGWRTADEERKNELKVEFKAGNWNQTTLPCIAFQAKTDADGKWLIDDGLSSGMALFELATEYAQEKACHDEIVNIRKIPVQDLTDEVKQKFEALSEDVDVDFPANWPTNIVSIFTNGLKDHVFNKYADDSSHVRRLWNASKHAAENNTYRQTTIVDSIKSAEDYINVHADDAVKEMMNVLGKGREAMIKRWVRCARALSGANNKDLMDQLKIVKNYLPATYVYDNQYFLGGEKRVGQPSLELDMRRKVAVLKCIQAKWEQRMDTEDGLGLSTLLQ